MSGPAPEVLGNFDGLDSKGQLAGWAWSPAEPSVRRVLGLYANDEQIARMVADRPRSDLAAQGFGDGNHGFGLPVPPHDGPVELTVRDAATGQRIGGVFVLGGAPAPAHQPLELVGNLDEVTADGWLTGWCWYPADPGRRAGINVYVDDVLVGTAVAAEDRPDLKAAAIGDGRHGFTFALPAVVLLQRGEVWITARDQQSDAPFGKPIIKWLGQTAPIDERIAQLERQVRMLRAEIEGYGRQALGHDEDRASRELFRTVGAFFQELADTPAIDGFFGAGLRAKMAVFSSRFPPITLVVPDRIEATIVIVATSPVETVYACLRSLVENRADRAAEIIVIDDGSQGGEAAWLPTVVRNLRYHHIPPGASTAQARNEIAASARSDVLIFIAPDLLATDGWLAALLDTLREQPDAALVGCRVLRRDGMIDEAGIALDDNLMPRRRGRAESAATAAYRFMRPVDAVAHTAFAVRRGAIPRDALFNDAYTTASASVLDLSLAARQSGWQVLYQPAASLERSTDVLRDDSLDPTDFVRLQRAWPSRDLLRPNFGGRILVIDSEVPFPASTPGASGLFEHMQALRRLDWRVTFVTADGRCGDERKVADLERNGIEVVRASGFSAPFDVLQTAGPKFSFVFFNRLASISVLLDRVRSLAPQAKVIYDPVELQFLREQREAAFRGGRRRATKADSRVAELVAIGAANAVIVSSDVEYQTLVGDVAANKLHVIRPAMAIAETVPPFQTRSGIVFIGGVRDASGIDAITWFVAEVFPLIQQVAPGILLTIVEPNPPASIRDLVGNGVVIVSGEAAIPSVLDGVRVSIAPHRFTSGRCREIAASLARGVPVVCTEPALDGSGISPGYGATTANDPAGFAKAVIRLHSSEPDWSDQSQRGVAACRPLHDAATAQAAWKELIRGLTG